MAKKDSGQIRNVFRKEVLSANPNSLHGDVLVLPRLRYSLLIALLIVWVLAVFIWLYFGSYARKETVQGWLEAPDGVVRLYPENSGFIEKVLVAEGERVQAGQPLIILSRDQTLANGAELEADLLEEYRSQSQLLDRQIGRTKVTMKARRESLQLQIDSLQKNLVFIKEQIITLQKRQRLISSRVSRYEQKMGTGYISKLEFEQVLSQQLSLRNDEQALLRERESQQDLLDQKNSELSLLPDIFASESDELISRKSEIAQSITQLEGRRARTVKATRDGVINNLQATEGQYVSPNNSVPLLTLSDGSSVFELRLLVPVRAVGFVEPGQNLVVRYDAFPFQKFGTYLGKVTSVTPTPLLPGEVFNSPVNIREPMYLVKASLSSQTINAYAQKIPLKSGITVTADIKLADRSLWQWLLEPIYSLRGRL